MMFFSVKRIIDPTYTTRLCEKLGTINAIKKFINVWPWRVLVPDEMVERLTFEECRTLLEQFRIGQEMDIHHRTKPNVIKRQAARAAKTFQEFKYVADQPYSHDDRGHRAPACIGMAETASTFEECMEALNKLDQCGMTSIPGYANSYNPEALSIKTLALVNTSEQYVQLATCKFASQEVSERATRCAIAASKTASDLIRIFKLDPTNPHLLANALELPGTDDDFIEIALLIKTPSFRLHALRKAIALVQPSII